MGFSITKVVPQHCNPPPPFLPHTFVRRQNVQCKNSFHQHRQAEELLFAFPPPHWSLLQPFCRLIFQVLIDSQRGWERERTTAGLFSSSVLILVCFQQTNTTARGQKKNSCSETCCKPQASRGEEGDGLQQSQGASLSPRRLSCCYLISPVCNYQRALAVSHCRWGPFRTSRRPPGDGCNRISRPLWSQRASQENSLSKQSPPGSVLITTIITINNICASVLIVIITICSVSGAATEQDRGGSGVTGALTQPILTACSQQAVC